MLCMIMQVHACVSECVCVSNCYPWFANGCGPGGTSGSHTIVLGHGTPPPAGY